jgi:hypothetical protein
LGIVGETFTVELVLEVLEGEGVVEDVDISDANLITGPAMTGRRLREQQG